SIEFAISQKHIAAGRPIVQSRVTNTGQAEVPERPARVDVDVRVGVVAEHPKSEGLGREAHRLGCIHAKRQRHADIQTVKSKRPSPDRPIDPEAVMRGVRYAGNSKTGN